jgi:hypothetical protein
LGSVFLFRGSVAVSISFFIVKSSLCSSLVTALSCRIDRRRCLSRIRFARATCCLYCT